MVAEERGSRGTDRAKPSFDRLIHVGPHKTGTTTVQLAFHNNRDALAGHGVHFLGPTPQPREAAKAVAGASGGSAREAGLRQWAELVAQSREAAGRVVLSSEFLCVADDAAARRVVADLGAAGTRVVVTLRPLSKVMPSQWQQFVKVGSVRGIDHWTKTVLNSYAAEPPTRFWRRHRHDRLVARWAHILGAENVSVIVVDDANLDQLPRDFATLLDLPDDVLVPRRSRANRSLTWEEAEVIRHFNVALEALDRRRTEAGLARIELSSEQRQAAWSTIQSRPASANHHRVGLPAFAAPRVGEIAREMTAAIVATGVDIIGDPRLLVEAARADESPRDVPVQVDAQVAAYVAAGILEQVLTS